MPMSYVQSFTTKLTSLFEEPKTFIEGGDKDAIPTDSVLREVGLLPQSPVAGQGGWIPIERVAQGDKLLTFDNGMQPVLESRTITLRRTEIPERKAFMMHIPKGILGNRSDMTVMPMQEIMLESDRAELNYGDPFVLLPAIMLDGYRGIRKVPLKTDLQLCVVVFECEEIIQTDGSLLALAPSQAYFSPFAETVAARPTSYPRLSHDQLRRAIDRRQSNRDPFAARAPFAAQNVDEAYAALEARLS